MMGSILVAVLIAAVIVGLILPERKKVGKTRDKIKKMLGD